MSELRWNPLLQEWVITATQRQDRTLLPPPDYCPLCPTQPGGFETEIPAPDFQIVVFENRFPALTSTSAAPSVLPAGLFAARPADGVCEVIVYTPVHETTLAAQSVEQIRRLIAVWTDRYRELGALPFVEYVYIFENKGEAIGVTLDHPHGQIYAYPFVPPIPRRELQSARQYRAETGNCLHCEIIAAERRDGRRLLFENESFLAVVPFYARWPYEAHLLARRHLGSLSALTAAEAWDLARAFKRLLCGYDALFRFSLPYVMAMHQSPTDAQEHPEAHFHVEFYPRHRTATKLKYLAGAEAGAGSFINDALAEDSAAALRAVLPAEEEEV